MRINIGLPSRGRPLDMVASAISLIRLSSGVHDVTITLGIDEDDPATKRMAFELCKLEGCQALVADRHCGLGDLVNSLCEATPEDAAFILWSDRISVTTLGWDQELALGCMQYPNRPIWLDSVHLAGAGQFILPPAWRAIQGPPCPPLYPFWFIDTAVEEIDAYVHGFPRIALVAKAAGPRGFKTNRMRDVEFWIDLFQAQRAERLRQAEMIGDRLGVKPPENLAAIVEYFTNRMEEMRARAPTLRDAFGEPGEPDETYLSAKAAAEGVLKGLRS